MSHASKALLVALSAATSLASAADGLPGLSFSHHDWELVCDNARTCRAAGYQSDADELPMSVLLTRKAGAGEAVTGQLMLGDADGDDASPYAKLPKVFALTLTIDGRPLGKLQLQRDNPSAELTAAQVSALLAALTRSSNIEWRAGKTTWHLSDKGAAAALLKMDEFQGRLGTQGALVRKGKKGEEGVLPALRPLVVKAARLARPLPADAGWLAKHQPALLASLRAGNAGEECSDLSDPDADKPEFAMTRLSANKLLVSTRCWMAAYNMGEGYWVVDDAPPFRPVLVTASGSDFSDGVISSSHKGRGIGDCWYSEEWTWDGAQFVQTGASSTGMCKLVAAGGAWSLPRIVTEVRPAP